MSHTRWWVLQASAPLQAVATQNYACFGRGGVPRHDRTQVVSPVASQTASDPATLCVELIIRAPDRTLKHADQPASPEATPAIRFANLDVTLTPQEQTDQRVIWSGYDAAQHLQTIWVWDFFRLLSHVVLRVADMQDTQDTQADAAPDLAWKHALDGLRAAAAGDVIALKVRSACGDIHQQHVLTGPAIQWEPA